MNEKKSMYDDHEADEDDNGHHSDMDDGDNEESNDDEEQLMFDDSRIFAMAKSQVQRDYRIEEFEQRLRRLQQLLNESEERHRNKDNEIEFLRKQQLRIADATDVKRSADNPVIVAKG